MAAPRLRPANGVPRPTRARTERTPPRAPAARHALPPTNPRAHAAPPARDGRKQDNDDDDAAAAGDGLHWACMQDCVTHLGTPPFRGPGGVIKP
eukprot:scaffold1930_cov346-Prasinococcus_capsulatus_cf.AAC.7